MEKNDMTQDLLSPLPSAFMKDGSPFHNQLLIAMPSVEEGIFSHSLIYLCAHSEEGAMGIVVNRPLPDVDFGDLLSQLQLPQSGLLVEPTIHFGGPVETGRGFVLHSTDFLRADTVRINDRLGMTGTVDILKAISEGTGPRKSLFALGYAGWGPGQLEAEMQANAWLTVTADEELLFAPDLGNKWQLALSRLGISPHMLSLGAGHA